MATYVVFPHQANYGSIVVEADEWEIDDPYNTVDFKKDDELVGSFFLHDIVGFVKK